MRKMLLPICSFLICITTNAQLTTLPDGGNKKAWVGERIGLTDVTIMPLLGGKHNAKPN